MFYREACIRFVTTAFGTRLGASTLREPVFCSCSTVQQRRSQPHDPPRRSTAPPIGRLITQHLTRPVFARAVSRAVSFAPPAFTPNRQADHDPHCLAETIIRLSSQRAPVMPRPPRACRSPAYALSSANLQHPPRITPPHNRDGDHPSANTMRSGRQSERLRSSHQLKIP
jgi:hypothetical protein